MPSGKFQESVAFEAIDPDRIDRDTGVVRGVRILGAISQNGRRYTEKAMRDAAELYEGLGVNLDHPDRDNPSADRSVRESFGELRNVKVRDGAVWADHYYEKTSDFAQQYIERCQRFPRQLGFSHVADGSYKMEEGIQVVESISAAESVDLVRKPATNKGLFESESREVNVIERISSDETVRELLIEAFGDVGIDPAMQMQMPGQDPTQDDSVKAAFRAAIMAVFDNPELDASATKKAIIRIIDTGELVSGGNLKDDEEPDEGDEMPQDMKKPTDQDKGADEKDKKAPPNFESENKRLKAENQVLRLLQSASVAPNEALIEALIPLDNEKRCQLIEQVKGAAPTDDDGRPPVSPPKFTESREEETDWYQQRWTEGLKATAAG